MRKEFRTVHRDGKTFQQAYWIRDEEQGRPSGRLASIFTPKPKVTAPNKDLALPSGTPQHENVVDRFRELQERGVINVKTEITPTVRGPGERYNIGAMVIRKGDGFGLNKSLTLSITDLIKSDPTITRKSNVDDLAMNRFAHFCQDVDACDPNDKREAARFLSIYSDPRWRASHEDQFDFYAEERDRMLDFFGVELYNYLVYNHVDDAAAQ